MLDKLVTAGFFIDCYLIVFCYRNDLEVYSLLFMLLAITKLPRAYKVIMGE